jgi:ferritin-like metal-binding protein YciE
MTLSDVFNDNIKDLYHAEKQLTKALPKLIKKATDSNLKMSLEAHLGETEEHVRRLEEAAGLLGIKPSGKVCHGMMGIVEEANEHTGELKPGALMDAVIIECAQKAEHYEICSYGTLCVWGTILGEGEVVNLLKQNLADEENADLKLTQIAESVVNEKALKEGDKPVAKSSKGSMNGKAVVSTAGMKTGATTASKATTANKEKAGAGKR